MSRPNLDTLEQQRQTGGEMRRWSRDSYGSAGESSLRKEIKSKTSEEDRKGSLGGSSAGGNVGVNTEISHNDTEFDSTIGNAEETYVPQSSQPDAMGILADMERLQKEVDALREKYGNPKP
jgi:hypothetical protein